MPKKLLKASPALSSSLTDVVLLHAHPMVTMATLHSLQSAGGYRITAVSHRSDSIVRFSRHCRFVEFPSWSWDGDASQLGSLSFSGKPVLFPVTLEAVRWVATNLADLSPNWAIPPIPDLATLEFTANKLPLCTLAQSLRCPVPPFVAASDWSPSNSPPFPVLLKPILGYGGEHIHRFETSQDLQHYLANNSIPESLVQTLVPGTAHSCGVFSLDGEVKAIVPYASLTRSDKYGPFISVSRAHQEIFAPTVEILVKHFRWNGLLNLDFMVDEKGHPWLLEANPRPWANLLAATMWGVNFVHMACQAALGQELDPPQVQGDHFYGMQDWFSRRLKPQSQAPLPIKSLWTETAIPFVLRDPLPNGYNVWRQGMSRLKAGRFAPP